MRNTAQQQGSPEGLIGYARSYGIWLAAFLVLGGVSTYFWRQNRRLKKASGDKVDAKVEGQNRAAITKPAAAERAAATERTAAMERTAVAEKAAAAERAAATDRTNSPLREVPGRDDRQATGREPVIPPANYGSAGTHVTSNSYVSSTPPVDPLLEARQLFEHEDSKGFYREVNRAVWKAIGKKLDLSASELNKSNSLRLLQMRGWDDTALMTLESLLSECEMNLYTPAYDRWNMQQLLRQAEWVMDRLA
jgi:hypothetical protein